MGKRTYTPEHDAFLMRHPILDRVILAALFNREFNENRSVEAIRNHCRRQLGLKMINRARFSKHKIGKRFKKGEYPKGCEKTWFKAGHDIHSHGIEHEFVKEGRVFIKVTSNLRPPMKNFKAKARWVWEQHHGEIKKAVEQATSQSQSAEFPYTLEAVERVLDEQLSGWNNGNIDQFMRGYVKDSSVRFITNKKVKTSWQEITDSYKKGYPNKEAMGKLTFHRDEIRWINETAGISQVIGRWEVIQKKQLAEVPGSISTSLTTVPPSADLKRRKPDPQFDTLSGRFSLIFIGTKEGPKIQVDHTW